MIPTQNITNKSGIELDALKTKENLSEANLQIDTETINLEETTKGSF